MAPCSVNVALVSVIMCFGPQCMFAVNCFYLLPLKIQSDEYIYNHASKPGLKETSFHFTIVM